MLKIAGLWFLVEQVCVSGIPKPLAPTHELRGELHPVGLMGICIINSNKRMEHKQKTVRRNKGGRPKKGAADKLKYRLTVKMATSDYYTLKGKARSAGISAGEFLRRCMRDGQVKERLTPEHTDYVRKLCGMANNLNQLAHKANAAGFVTVKIECRILVARIEELLNLILL